MVSDHAVVRWLERVEKVDIDSIRRELSSNGEEPSDPAILGYLWKHRNITKGYIIWKLLRDNIIRAIKLGATRINSGEWSYIIRNGTVITVEPRRSMIAKSGRYRRKYG